jgi:hypothetical protein
MANGIDTPLNAAELPTRDPIFDSSPLHPQRQELLAADDTMLSLGELSNSVVKRTRRGFSAPDMGNPRLVDHRCQ